MLSPIKLASLAFVASAAILTWTPAFAQPAPAVSELSAEDVQSDGVWKIFFRPRSGKEKIARVAELDFATNKLIVRVNGKVHRLVQDSETWTPKRTTGCVVGDTCIEKWSDGKVRVELNYKIVGSGEENQQFKGVMKVASGSDSQTFPVEGETGS